MNLFYKVSRKEMLALRDGVFKERGMPFLIKKGFSKSPFSTSWFGSDDIGGFTYEFCRISKNHMLEMITVRIIKNDKWVKFYLNIFKLSPGIRTLDQLEGIDGLQFHLPPNSKSLMRLSPPDGIIFAGLPQHKVRYFFSREGLKRRLRHLGDKIEEDMKNIDSFIGRWLENYEPNITDWSGNAI
jgi:hypothetical protein